MALPRIDISKYELTLPSTGKTIEYRPYTVKEEKILMLAKESGKQKDMARATRDLIGACTLGAVDVNKLTMFDFEYIFLMLRSKSVGETSDLVIKCKNCDAKNDVTINIEDVRVDGGVDSKKMKIQLTQDVGIVMRYPTYEMAEAISSTSKSETTSTLKVVTKCIESIYDSDNVYPADEQTDKELEEFMDSIPSNKFKEMADILNNIPAVVLDASFKCIKCGEVNDTPIRGLGNFFS